MVPETVFIFQFVPLSEEPMVASDMVKGIMGGGLAISGAGDSIFFAHFVALKRGCFFAHFVALKMFQLSNIL
jgi:hypothetical protein